MTEIREIVAHAMWLEQAKRAGTPSVIAGRTPIAFANTADQTRREWLGYADAALVAIPAPAVPDDVAKVQAMKDANWKPSVQYWREKAEAQAAELARLRGQIAEMDSTLTTAMRLASMEMQEAAFTQPTGDTGA